MEILVYDTEISNEDVYNIVSDHLNIKFIKTNDEKSFYLEYNRINNDSLIIIDVTGEIGEQLFNYITNNNPKQKIIALSKTLSYNLTFSCTECAKLFNRKLLLKPIHVGQLVSYIKNFDNLLCKYSSDSNEISEIMNDILEQFIYYNYDKNQKMIMLKEGHSPNIREFIKVTELLNTHNIRFVIEDQNIKLNF